MDLELAETLLNMRNRHWTEWTDDERATFRLYLKEIGEPPFSALGYTTVCSIIEAIYEQGVEGQREDIDLETPPPVVSDHSRKVTNVILRVLAETAG